MKRNNTTKKKIVKALFYFIDYLIAFEEGVIEGVFQKHNILWLLAILPIVLQVGLHELGLFTLETTLQHFYLWIGTVLFSGTMFSLWLFYIFRNFRRTNRDV